MKSRRIVTRLFTMVFVAACAGQPVEESPLVGPVPDILVVGHDYSFEMPKDLPPGRTTFGFTNKGKFAHEFNMVLLNPKVSIQQFMAAANAELPLTSLIDGTVGVLFADPGNTTISLLSTDLLPGRTYAVRCIMRDRRNAPRHQEIGMFAELRVRDTAAKLLPAVTVDTIVGMDYAFRYPQTLAPGVHHLYFVNGGKQRHEVVVGLLAEGVTLKDFVDASRADTNAEDLIDRSLGILHSPGGTAPAGLLVIDFLPGREYVIVCSFSDSPTSPPHHSLGMVGSIRVTQQ